jgi:hypothetical protein
VRKARQAIRQLLEQELSLDFARMLGPGKSHCLIARKAVICRVITVDSPASRYEQSYVSVTNFS